MFCLMCEEFSLTHICKDCQKIYLTPKLYKRKLPNNIDVYSFYAYEEIKHFLHTKHTHLGYYIYHIMAKNSFALFAKEFSFATQVYSIGIDEHLREEYSHTAILNSYLHSQHITPLYQKLLAKNRVSYSKKSKNYRETNLRDFQLNTLPSDATEFILVDDIITTGSTLTQAINTLHSVNKEVLFCLTLADVSD